MCAYRKTIVIQGGSSGFMQDLKRRSGFNGIWSFDTTTGKWEMFIETLGQRPTMRHNHGGAALGGVMLIVGGHNTEARAVMDDFNLFDF
jgi:hypothetical protein